MVRPIQQEVKQMAMIRETKEGCFLEIEVTPNAKTFSIEDVDPWLERLKIKVSESPVKGKANKELVTKLEKKLKTKPVIVKGEKSNKKTLFMELSKKELRQRLGI